MLICMASGRAQGRCAHKQPRALNTSRWPYVENSGACSEPSEARPTEKPNGDALWLNMTLRAPARPARHVHGEQKGLLAPVHACRTCCHKCQSYYSHAHYLECTTLHMQHNDFTYYMHALRFTSTVPDAFQPELFRRMHTVMSVQHDYLHRKACPSLTLCMPCIPMHDTARPSHMKAVITRPTCKRADATPDNPVHLRHACVHGMQASRLHEATLL